MAADTDHYIDLGTTKPERSNIVKTIIASKVPGGSLLTAYLGGGAYADCYSTTVSGSVSQAQYVEAFYTTHLFKIERALLRLVFSPSTDAAARELALGQTSTFAIWRVENRRKAELLLAAGRTRSWLMAEPAGERYRHGTRLHFGSAVVPKSNGQLGFEITALRGFHRLYSRALLQAAKSRLEGVQT